MPIEMPKGVPFSVDTWTPNSKAKRHHFLTHAHKDHSQGILSHASYPIYSTHLTKALVLQYCPQLDDGLFVGIEVGQTLVIDDPDWNFTVTAFDANHCPGAVMFLFEGRFGNILHTGDCRLIPEILQCLPEKYVGKKGKEPRCPLDYVFLDCTFGRSPLKMPSRQSAIQQVINCIWKHPGAPIVYLTCDVRGQEEILVQVCQAFGCKIYVDKEKNPECYQALELIVPEILSEDSSSRFQVFDGFPKLYERAEAKIAEAHANFKLELLIIRPSAQWYACEEGLLESENKKKGRYDQAVRDIFGVWHVCYSMHSSREELDWALQLLAPKWVISTTPSCRAMELDYVKRHCFNTKRPSHDSLWRLLDINTETSLVPDIVTAEKIIKHDVEPQPQQTVVPISCRRQIDLPSPSKRPSVTLFGRARLGIGDSFFKHDKETLSKDYNFSHRIIEDPSPKEVEVIEVECERPLEENREVEEETNSWRAAEEISPTRVEIVEAESNKSLEEKREVEVEMFCKSTKIKKRVSSSPIGSSKSFDESLRRFYRSMNISVPQPLPSLVELMNGYKCTRRRF